MISKIHRCNTLLGFTFLEKRKWSDVEYADYYCYCNYDQCSSPDRGRTASDLHASVVGGKRNLISSGCNVPSPGANVRCRASGTISAPPVPAVLMVRGSSAGRRCESVSRSGSSGCSSQQSCCCDDEDAYVVSPIIFM